MIPSKTEESTTNPSWFEHIKTSKVITKLNPENRQCFLTGLKLYHKGYSPFFERKPMKWGKSTWCITLPSQYATSLGLKPKEIILFQIHVPPLNSDKGAGGMFDLLRVRLAKVGTSLAAILSKEEHELWVKLFNQNKRITVFGAIGPKQDPPINAVMQFIEAYTREKANRKRMLDYLRAELKRIK